METFNPLQWNRPKKTNQLPFKCHMNAKIELEHMKFAYAEHENARKRETGSYSQSQHLKYVVGNVDGNSGATQKSYSLCTYGNISFLFSIECETNANVLTKGSGAHIITFLFNWFIFSIETTYAPDVLYLFVSV